MRSTSAATSSASAGVPGHQPGQPVGPVLGLHDQVDGGEGRRRVRAGDHHDLGGPGEGRRHADDARHLALGLGHVGVARAGDDVDRGHAARPVGHGGDGLGPADPVDLVDPGDGGGAQRGVVDPAVGGRGHAQRDAPHAGHPGRRRAHEDGRGVAGPPARRVDAGPLHGARQVADGDAALDQVARRRALVRVVGQDAAEGHLEGLPEVGVGVGAGLLDLLRGDPQAVGHVDPVQLGGVAHEGLVALGAHLAQDLAPPRRGRRPRAPRARQDRVEGRRRAAEVQDAEGHEATRLPAGLRPVPCAGVPRRGRRRPMRPSSGDDFRRRDLLALLHPDRTARPGHRPGRERAGQRRRGHGPRAHRRRTLPRRGAAAPAALRSGPGQGRVGAAERRGRRSPLRPRRGRARGRAATPPCAARPGAAPPRRSCAARPPRPRPPRSGPTCRSAPRSRPNGAPPPR